jgi:hypothetical protein
MLTYHRFQFAWLLNFVFLLVILLMTLCYIYQWGNNPVDIYGYVFFVVLFAGILLLFYGITITVTNKYLKIKIGIGIISRKIDLSTIQSVSVQKYPVYCGYGIRITSRGVLYNVSGRHAVELRIRNKKDAILIGTNDWDNLKNIIEAGMNQTKSGT